MNPRLQRLQAYPFERLRKLLEGLPPGREPIDLSIGEPQHPTPTVITEEIAANLHLLGRYPPTKGTLPLREAVSEWLGRRYGVRVDPEREVLPVAGSREALFAFAQAALDPGAPGVVLVPNPGYQIYEGAALMAGAESFYVPTPGGLPDWNAVPAEMWPRVRLVYVCSPSNPQGVSLDQAGWLDLFARADQYGFTVAADEPYSELYEDEPPVGVLEAARERGWERLVTFNSLSKRSSAPGLRSGFVAGDAAILERFLLYRSYHGAAPSGLTQAASAAAWTDEAHVDENRRLYTEKRRLWPGAPSAGFFLWPSVEDGEEAALRLWREFGLKVLPGAYLGRHGVGRDRVRAALVPSVEVCAEARTRWEEAFRRGMD